MVALSPALTRRRLQGPTLRLALACLLLAASLLSLTSEAAGLGAGDIVCALWGEGLGPRDRVVLFDIRLPRLVLGAAVGAALAVTGILTYLADDQQLRDLTFWSMGSLAGATWAKLAAALPLIALALLVAPRLARGLNLLALGEAQAAHMGTDVQRLKRATILAAAAATGAAVAVSGGIGFVGIVVPHLLRKAQGPDHRQLIPNAALLGAALLVLADLVSRTIVTPSELPIGCILTALIGAPVFLWMLLHGNLRGR